MFSVVGKIIAVVKSTTGKTRENKDLLRREYILEQDEKYRQKLRFSHTAYGLKINDMPDIGDMVEVECSIECREYKGNWYNDVRAYKLEKIKQ